MLVTFSDGKQREYTEGVTPYEIAESISLSLAKSSIYANYAGEDVDMTRPLHHSGTILFKDEKESFSVLNHSCAHLMALAVKHLYPQAKFGIGPAIEEGFYYDIDPGEGIKFTEAELDAIAKEMEKAAALNLPFIYQEVSKDEAKDIFKDDKYKTELICELEAPVSIYKTGDYVDLCKGPHVKGTGLLKNFKLLSVAGAYWRGDVSRPMLQRIYGTCFFRQSELKKHLLDLEERKKRDHRRLGKELELFMMSDYGPGFPFWLPKGMTLRNTLMQYWQDLHVKAGYEFIQTPIMLNRTLWEISGHWANYKENMYTSSIENLEYAIKPMNCPGCMLVYKNSIHSYKDFPLRLGELGIVHRHEASGALNGLFRVRAFTQDDAHLFMREDQIETEIASTILLFKKVYSDFNLDFTIELSTRPESKYIGSTETWDKAEKALAGACHLAGFKFKLNPGDGAFYGPKLDFKLRDSMNRIWQCGTIQLDMNLPERFDLTYVAEDGSKKRPVMIHRALFGSIERFIGILIEHYGGAFPTWLAPVQVKIIPVNNKYHLNYAMELNDALREKGIRTELDIRDEKMGYKIREAQMKKIPYQLVVGDKELSNNEVNARRYGTSRTVQIPVAEFISDLLNEIKTLGKEHE